MNVTFDSNTWRAAANPSRFDKNPEYKAYLEINSALKSNIINGFLSESIFTLEGIPKNGRKRFITEYEPKITSRVCMSLNNKYKIETLIESDTDAHPGNNSYLSSHLKDALSVNFKLMRSTRLCMIENPDLDDRLFINNPNDYYEKFNEISKKIEVAGAGIYQLKTIGKKYASSNQKWIDGLKNAPESEDGCIDKAVAEWADSESVAAHYASGNDLFCTNDKAKGAGNHSIFSNANRSWLSSDYGIKFTTPTELATLFY